MPPPLPATPSPRRFLNSNKSTSKQSFDERSAQKPPSNLRFSRITGNDANSGNVNTNTTPQQSSVRPTSAHSQFAATPKFSFAKAKRHDALLLSPDKPRPVFTARDSGEEGIEDVGNEDHEDDQDEMILETTEVDPNLHLGDDRPPSPKRQRRSLDDTVHVRNRMHDEPQFSSRPNFDIPPARPTPSPIAARPPRFLFAQPTPTLVSTLQPIDDPDAGPIARPVFLKPPSTAEDTTNPLPEAFSPHRRGQKFTPGGMASEVRQWIVDATQAGNFRRITGDLMRARVMESRGSTNDGVVLVRGSVEGSEVKLLLPGAGKGKNSTGLTAGQIVAVKAPTWDVLIDGVAWIVAADWRVLGHPYA
ncbi:hypothetical protein EJ08DRAFT_42666 [Tothia fuscella]|uniref:Uncharacterized protein n=1 Tax=Tothia fuscella TaxID=1048955 RepID=A0A9P4TT63_9PEZI|nr:hypothetical protein EJ08DRAFT_42666 [Tothia fuscella]